MKIAAIIISMIGMAGCANKDGLPSGILRANQMQAVLWDVIRAETYATQYIKKDSLKNADLENAKLQQQIFATHNISREDFYDSYQYYNKHTELMRILLDSITTRGERERYTTLYSKRSEVKTFSLMPLPPEPPVLPIPTFKPITVPITDSTQKSTHKFLPVPVP